MNSAMRDYQEKRNYIRMKIDAPVSVQLITNGSVENGVCRDLSGGGMMIEMNCVLPVGTVAEVTISSAHGHNPMLVAKAEVARVISQPESQAQPCLLGLNILEVLN
ncbi:MAG: PilZ domain-containing protein [Agarilytica sp.]